MKIGITGATGFIGKKLIQDLRLKNYDFLGIDKNCLQDNAEIKYFDLAFDTLHQSPNKLDKLFKNCDIIVHLAYLPGMKACEKNFQVAWDINVLGTRNIIHLCTRQNIPLLFVSTIGVIGEPLYQPIDEKHPYNINREANPYIKMKTLNELEIRLLLKDYYIVRLTNVFGGYFLGGQYISKPTVINKFLDLAKDGKTIIMEGGDQERDFIHIDDVSRAIIGFIEKRPQWGVYNLGSGFSMTIKGIASRISSLTGIDIQESGSAAGASGEFKVDVGKLHDALSITPQIFADRYIQEKTFLMEI